MSATDELRALLDERGVKCSNPVQMEGSEFTRWHDANGTQWTASEVTHADSKLRIGASHVTPAQAIAATLGREECELEEGGWSTEGDHARVWLTCGHDCMVETVADLPKFCPKCGRQVKR